MRNTPVAKPSPIERMAAATSGDLFRQEELLYSIRGTQTILIFLVIVAIALSVWQLLLIYHPEWIR